MADVAEEILETVTEAVQQAAENLTDASGEITGKKVPSTPEGEVYS